MTTRNRMTWQRQKQASPPPASYGWTPDHPAFYPDPDADKYKNGDTSSWAEDPTKGPYPQGPAPASYSWKPEHPAAKPDAGGPIPPPVGPDAGKKAALRQQVEKKAAKCIRVASAILGKGASVQSIEDKALSLMDMPERHIDAALVKVRQAYLLGSHGPMGGMMPMGEDMDGDGIDQNDPFTYDFTGEMDIEPPPIMAEDDDDSSGPEEQMLKAMLEEQEGGHDHEANLMLAEMLQEEQDKEKAEGEAAMKMAMAEKEAAAQKTAMQLEAALKAIASLQNEVATLKSAKKAEEKGEKDPMGVEAEEDEGDAEAKKLAALFGMKSAKGMKAEEKEEKAEGHQAEEEGDKEAKKMATLIAKLAKALKAEDDEGEGDDEGDKEAKKMATLLAKLAADGDDDGDDDGVEAEDESSEEGKSAKKHAYQSLFASDGDDDGDEGEGEEVEVEMSEEEGKKASVRPQARKASAGVKSLGAVRTASAAGGSDLSALWKSAPDVSDHF